MSQKTLADSLLIVTLLMGCQSTPPRLAESCGHDATSFRCVEYVSNYDGDTIKVNIPNTPPLFGREIGIRLKGIDTAELKSSKQCEKKAAADAAELVKQLLSSAKRIDLTDVERDKYFRIVANVIADGRSVSDALLSKSLAYNYDGGKKKQIDWCKERLY